MGPTFYTDWSKSNVFLRVGVLEGKLETDKSTRVVQLPSGSPEAPSGAQQRPVGEQMYGGTAVWRVQKNVAIERMVAVVFSKKGTQTCAIENTVINHWGRCRGGGYGGE
jgi:hypothetical protein